MINAEYTRDEHRHSVNHLVSEGFLNSSFSRVVVKGKEGGLFPKSYSTLYWTLQSSPVNDNNNITSTTNIIAIQDASFSATAGNLTGSLAYKIDKKIDDGYPKTGIMGNLNEARCLTGPTNNTDNAYDTSEAGSCQMTYKLE